MFFRKAIVQNIILLVPIGLLFSCGGTNLGKSDSANGDPALDKPFPLCKVSIVEPPVNDAFKFTVADTEIFTYETGYRKYKSGIVVTKDNETTLKFESLRNKSLNWQVWMDRDRDNVFTVSDRVVSASMNGEYHVSLPLADEKMALRFIVSTDPLEMEPCGEFNQATILDMYIGKVGDPIEEQANVESRISGAVGEFYANAVSGVGNQWVWQFEGHALVTDYPWVKHYFKTDGQQAINLDSEEYEITIEETNVSAERPMFTFLSPSLADSSTPWVALSAWAKNIDADSVYMDYIAYDEHGKQVVSGGAKSTTQQGREIIASGYRRVEKFAEQTQNQRRVRVESMVVEQKGDQDTGIRHHSFLAVDQVLSLSDQSQFYALTWLSPGDSNDDGKLTLCAPGTDELVCDNTVPEQKLPAIRPGIWAPFTLELTLPHRIKRILSFEQSRGEYSTSTGIWTLPHASSTPQLVADKQGAAITDRISVTENADTSTLRIDSGNEDVFWGYADQFNNDDVVNWFGHIIAEVELDFDGNNTTIIDIPIDSFNRTYQSKPLHFYSKTTENPSVEVLTIPVVVHVLYHENNLDGNIRDSKIQSQIDVLNEDFRARNTDIIKVPSEFSRLVADMEIEFVLASMDPEGNPSDGITRTVDKTGKDIEGRYYTSRGGKDAWPTDRYLNIWVVDVTDHDGNAIWGGRGQQPGGNPDTDGVVVVYSAFGREEPLTDGLRLGRTATHEIGHWLNLNHTSGLDCNWDDGVDDTPSALTGTVGTNPSHPHATCESNDMFMNFMSLVQDQSMYMFSQGQKARVWEALSEGGGRHELYKNILNQTAVATTDSAHSHRPR